MDTKGVGVTVAPSVALAFYVYQKRGKACSIVYVFI